MLLRADTFAVVSTTSRRRCDSGDPELAVARGDASQSLRTASFDGEKYRVVAVPTDGGEGRRWSWRSRWTSSDRLLARLGFVTCCSAGWACWSAGLAGWAVARNGLRPVRRLTTAVEDIARTEDLRPLPVEGDDEVARLATAFNPMLIALAASRDRQRRLVADAGHELRTPLTSLRTNLDLLDPGRRGTTGRPSSPRPGRELLDDVRAQIEELTTLIGDLVELARDEPPRPVVEPVDLADVVDHARSPGTPPRARRSPSTSQRRPVVGGRRGRRARARDHQPARQRRQVEPARRHRHRPAQRRRR